MSVPDCSFQETYPEWINPVTGEETGEQTVDINCEAHLGLYYFETRAQYEDWKTNTLDNLAPQVDEVRDGEMVELPKDMLPTKTNLGGEREIEEEGNDVYWTILDSIEKPKSIFRDPVKPEVLAPCPVVSDHTEKQTSIDSISLRNKT